MMSDGECVVCNTKLHNIKVFKYHKCARQFLHRFSNNDEETNFKSRVEEGVEFTKRWMEKQISHELSGLQLTKNTTGLNLILTDGYPKTSSKLKKKSDYVHS